MKKTDVKLVAEVIKELIKELRLHNVQVTHHSHNNKILICHHHTNKCVTFEQFIMKGSKLIDQHNCYIDLSNPYSLDIIKSDIGLSYGLSKYDSITIVLLTLPLELAKYTWRSKKYTANLIKETYPTWPAKIQKAKKELKNIIKSSIKQLIATPTNVECLNKHYGN